MTREEAYKKISLNEEVYNTIYDEPSEENDENKFDTPIQLGDDCQLIGHLYGTDSWGVGRYE